MNCDKMGGERTDSQGDHAAGKMLFDALLVLVGLLILSSLVGLILVSAYWYVFRRPLARHRGTQRLPGLGAPVEVLRDAWGIPHIYAQSEGDLLFAQGYVHAQDRLWQMEFQRRAAAGRLSEAFGRAALDADRFSRTLGLRRAAEAEAASLDEGSRTCLESYCLGINRFIESHRHRLPAEFILLGIQPERWTPVDCLSWLKLFGWTLSTNWEMELARLHLLSQVGSQRAAEVEPDYPKDHPTILPTGVHARDTVAMLLHQYEQVKGWFGPTGPPLGSNSWVVHGDRTVTGKPLLANDPHLAVMMPAIWYENHLVAGEMEVTGVSFPGFPFVIIGHNADFGWGFTAALVDNTDLYVERFDPQKPNRYEFRGEWEEGQSREEAIRIKGEDEPILLPVRETRHGPLISDLVNAPLPLALCWIGHRPAPNLRALRRLNRARTGHDVQEVLRDCALPPLNVTYADVEGNIGYVLAGEVPIREKGWGSVPVPGWTGEYEWCSTIPRDELPRRENPEEGFLVTANNRIVDDDYPYLLTLEWSAGFRAQRIREMLGVRRRVTMSDCQTIQLDTVSLSAQEVVPYFTQLEPKDYYERFAVRQLREWDTRLDLDSTGGAIYEVASVHLLELVFGDKLGVAREAFMGKGVTPILPMSTLSERTFLRLLELLRQERSDWFMDARTGQARSRDEIVAEALKRAVNTLRQTLGSDTRRWQWGRLHQVGFVHPLGTTRLFRRIFNRGPYPLGGGTDTVATGVYPRRLPIGMTAIIPSYRQVLDLAAWDRSISVHTTGQSGQPGHPHYADQMHLWREGEYHPMLWSRQRVEERTEARLRLEPG